MMEVWMHTAEKKERFVFIVSDSSGETASRAIKAALELFHGSRVTELRFPGVRTVKEIEEIVHEAASRSGFVLYTLADGSHREALRHIAQQNKVVAVDLFKELIPALSEYLHVEPAHHPSHEEDLRRLHAMEFFRKQEDGQNPDGLLKAEFVVIGLSRMTKTPVCMRLADNGFLAANVPLALEVTPPAELFRVPAGQVFVLTMQPGRLRQYRLQRISKLGVGDDDPYVDPQMIARETEHVRRLAAANPRWRVIDVTHRQVEETAAEIIHLSQSHGA